MKLIEALLAASTMVTRFAISKAWSASLAWTRAMNTSLVPLFAHTVAKSKGPEMAMQARIRLSNAAARGA